MGKYDDIVAETQSDLLLKKIVNELAEKNRIDRHFLKTQYDLTLRDEA
jgi:hypothetical protein